MGAKKVNWAVLGTAWIAYSSTIPGILLSSNCELYAVAGRSEEKVNNFKEKFGFKKAYLSYDELLKDENVDAVYIPLTNDLHKEWVIKALKAKKHVLCEKPMALSAKDAKDMFDTAKANGVFLMEAFAYLHGDYMKSLVKEVKDGVIGDILYIDTAFLTQGYKSNFRLKKSLGGGMIYDLGVYCTSMILSLVDGDIEYVKAVAEKNEDGVDAFSSAILKFKNGTRASFDVGMILGTHKNSRHDRLFIKGTKGEIHSSAEYNGEGELSYRIIKDDCNEIIDRKINVKQNYSLEVGQLSNCILNGDKPYVTSDFSMRNAKLIDLLLESIDY